MTIPQHRNCKQVFLTTRFMYRQPLTQVLDTGTCGSDDSTVVVLNANKIFLLLLPEINLIRTGSSCSSTYWRCEKGLLAGTLGAGPEAGVLGWGRVTMEREVSAGEVRRWGGTRRSWTFRTQAAAFTVTAAVAAARRRRWRHLQHLGHSIHTCHSNRQIITAHQCWYIPRYYPVISLKRKT